MRASLVAVPVLAAAAVLAAPSAVAQLDADQANQVQLDVEEFDDPIEPLEDLVNVTATVEIPCGRVSENGTRAVAVAVASKPDWVGVTVSPSTVFVDATDCDTDNTTARGHTSLILQTTAEGPAYQPANVTVEATSDGMEPGIDAIAVEAGFYAVLDAQTPRPVVVAGPQEQIDLEVELNNYGNGPVEISPEIRGQPGGLKAVVPGTLTVGSNATGGPNQRTVTVSVQTPFHNGYVDEQGVLDVRWSARYAPDPSAGGANATTRFRIATKGVYVPGPGAALAAGALAATSLAAAGLRDRDR